MRAATLIFLVLSIIRPANADDGGITILYDAFGNNAEMKHDWGFAALIEYRGQQILFDTGNDPATLERNLKTLAIELKDIDFAVISHRHGDHTGGLSHLLAVNPDVQIYTPKENFGVFGMTLPGSFYERDASLPESMRYFGGNAPSTIQSGSAWPKGNFAWISENTEIAPGIHLVIERGEWGVDLDVMELSLAIETADGLVIVAGCSHPTVEKIVSAAKEVTDKPIHLIVGGLHLLPAGREEIYRVAVALKDTWNVRHIAPGHCTGEPAFAILRETFADNYLSAGVGERIKLSGLPRHDTLPVSPSTKEN